MQWCNLFSLPPHRTDIAIIASCAAAAHSPEYIDTAWASKVKLVIFDFDKTITARHTQGSIPVHQKHKAEDEYINNNFADLSFLKFVVPFIKAQNCQVAIASFGEFNEDALLSGKDLIRKYLDTAFGESKSKDMFPDHVVKFWHPESRGKDPKKIGKQDHIAAILKDLPKRPRPSEICLFDDDEHNIEIARKKGHRTFFCPAIKADVIDAAGWDCTKETTGFHRGIWKDFIKAKGGTGAGCVIM
jgi:hypothetical protein